MQNFQHQHMVLYWTQHQSSDVDDSLQSGILLEQCTEQF